MLKNILYFSASVVVFFAGIIVYGIILNASEESLTGHMINKGLSKINNAKIIVDRDRYELHLYSDSILVKSYKAVFGNNINRLKTSRNDFITPRGNYFICEIDTNYMYHKLLKLNYPNETDAAEALRNELITQSEYIRILDAHRKKNCVPADTKLGSDISIHGIGEYDFIFRNLPFVYNWTNGSIAVSNQSIDEIYSVIQIGTHVIIK